MKRSGLLWLSMLLLTASAYCQQFDVKRYDAAMATVLEKAYPASVRMWGFDTTTRQQMSAQFSGVVVSADGYIFTAAHTTTPGQTYLVMFPDGKQAIAQALGKIEMADDRTVPDVSMMKIVTPGVWPFAEIGYSSSLKEGVPCVSIAYPESLNQPLPTLRFGHIVTLHNEKGFIQSTCIMEPGDSGGPLFDMLGRVIGLHSAIWNTEEFNFEIPVDLYRKYFTALKEAKKFNAFPTLEDKVDADKQAADIQPWPQLKGAFTSVDAKLSQSCVSISSSKGKAQGAILEGGYIVSKSSQVSDTPEVFYNKRKLDAKVLRRDKLTDLVLLQMQTPVKGGVKINTGEPAAGIGQLLISPRAEQAGVMSVASNQAFSLPRVLSAGFFGASVPYKPGAVKISFIRANSPAALAGLQVGDRIVSINQVVMDKPENYGNELQRYWPGDTLTVAVERNDSTFSSRIVLTEKAAQPASGHPAESFPGGKSHRRDGLDPVFAHDAILQPEACGGPVFDVNGHFKGINIARYSRTSTLAVPASAVFRLVEQVRAGK
ncbi:trypsin-like peptidase domain-containing protein [Chitinophaga horti]|uniref:Trypsin-like peptidase domain-containing protein n=1 Tax=Chitinophaga horti TaxID=2920382 RepID=A0ABY6IWF3_9BACT|nr:trypsin-like peptidase domain-containing protein [Chitinophaga horti]UYQ91707.1 trypsin-like peptidase domain-containing protein [Chitinophaga horti]